MLTCSLSNPVCRIFFIKRRGANNGDFTAEALLAVIAVPSGFLTERRQTMADDLMAHAPVADEADGERAMLDDRFVTSFSNSAYNIM